MQTENGWIYSLNPSNLTTKLKRFDSQTSKIIIFKQY